MRLAAILSARFIKKLRVEIQWIAYGHCTSENWNLQGTSHVATNPSPSISGNKAKYLYRYPLSLGVESHYVYCRNYLHTVPIVNLQFHNGIYHPFMVILGIDLELLLSNINH